MLSSVHAMYVGRVSALRAVCRSRFGADLLVSGLDNRRRWRVSWSAFLGGAGSEAFSLTNILTLFFAGMEVEEWESRGKIS